MVLKKIDSGKLPWN